MEQIITNAANAYHADNKIKESEEKFRIDFESMTDVFTRSDMNGKCVLISPSIYKMTGYQPEEIIGKNFADFYADPKQRNEIVNELKSTKDVINFEIDIVRKDGKLISLSSFSFCLY